jgi:hypothetical protein
MAEEVFTNVQILKGIPVDQFMGTMGFLSASLGLNCTDCHSDESGGDWKKYADDTPLKRTTRRMMTMVQTINEMNFGGRQMVTCDTCHRGTRSPNVMPSLDLLYASPPDTEPGDPITQAEGQPAPAVILDRFLAAVGGAQRVGALTSFAATGTYHAYDDAAESPMEVYATAAGQRTTLVRGPAGVATWMVDTREGWVSAPPVDRPLPLMQLTGGDLEGAQLEARMFFPASIAASLRNLRTGFPTTINNRPVAVVQGTTPGGAVATLSFDKETGLLVRLTRYNASPIGRIVTRSDYSDYREVAGVKLPFKWTLTWLDGRSVYTLSEVKANVRIDPARFNRPAPGVMASGR